MGSAFFLWDKAIKGGDPRIIGSISYLTLLLATLWLTLFTEEKLTFISGLGMFLLLSGSLIGSLDILRNTGGLYAQILYKPVYKSFFLFVAKQQGA